MTRTLILSLLLLLSSGWGCGPGSLVTVPDGFVALKGDLNDDVAQKMVSADGAVVVVRERDNDPYGDLNFWSEALEREIKAGRGYDLIATEEVGSVNHKGRLLKFKGAFQEETFHYNVAIFTTPEQIVTVETVVTEENATRHEETLIKTISSLIIAQ